MSNSATKVQITGKTALKLKKKSPSPANDNDQQKTDVKRKADFCRFLRAAHGCLMCRANALS